MKAHRMFFKAVMFPKSLAAGVLLLALLLAMAASNAPAAHAATTITVNSTADTTANDGVCTLREAIINANNDLPTWADCSAGDGADVINITATGTITLLSALAPLSDSVTINGSGASSLTISGANTYRVFHVLKGGATFNFQNMTIANASAGFGGGIYAQGASGVSVSNVTFSNNGTTSTTGGAIYNGTGHPLTVTNSTFINNQGYGGAIANDSQSTLIVANSTFSGNNRSGSGAGTIAQIGGLGSAALTNVTISSSDAGSAVYVGAGSLTLRNSIVVSSSGPSCGVLAGRTITNGGNNIDSGTSCLFGSTAGSMSSTDPKLGSLGNNGGPTQTMALLADSPAVNAGNATICTVGVGPSTYGAGGLDQRGLSRRNGFCDIGAFEAQPASLTVVSGSSPQTSLVHSAFPLPLKANVTDANSNALGGIVVTYAAPASGASAILSATTATSNASGNASVTATANSVFGAPYNVMATVSGLTPINFVLTNKPLSVFLPLLRR